MKEPLNNIKKRSKPLQKNLQILNMKKDSPTIPPLISKPVKITKVRDAKRLLSKMIYEFQLGKIENQSAKDLTYMLMTYVNICTQVDFEERLSKLEAEVKWKIMK